MPCLLALLALFVPRLVILGLWFFTRWFEGLFDTLLWPVLGFLFAPTTLLWYSVVQNVYDGTWGTLQIIVLVIAVMIDFSPSAGRRKK
ncbi:hypothetical protein GQ464_013075 [Rhodocaloribacter litoris]|uniref:hypothetical protein n=1 Tax=Rhodocaloribacter litoris TaxID=2558931 RepID=UPI001420D832|nr:hypothetical protein [Rhodocaloribacter litoris]QXD14364.1 hypothetical protein GQ464_013075 [Rhodocaloribacter litoris]GIV60614.1 MAG: hypothetical protein KatS3mg043_1703 [Rhodothermaceae bacterium]